MAETTHSTGRVGSYGSRLPWPLTAPIRVLPLAPLQSLSTVAMHIILDGNPGIIERLGEHATKRFVLDPVDCPFVYVLEPHPDRPTVTMRRGFEENACDARIAAPLIVLLGLLDGSYDGDALFFSRDIVVEGDIAAILALRNAIENADLDVGRLLGLSPMLAPLVTAGMRYLADGVRLLFAGERRTGSSAAGQP